MAKCLHEQIIFLLFIFFNFIRFRSGRDLESAYGWSRGEILEGVDAVGAFFTLERFDRSVVTTQLDPTVFVFSFRNVICISQSLVVRRKLYV